MLNTNGNYIGTNEIIEENRTDFFLLQLQKRLLFLATVDNKNTTINSKLITSLNKLITLLYESQNNGNGAVTYCQLKEFLVDIDKLIQVFPRIIGDDKDNNMRPIIVFPPFVAFRRNWKLYKNIKEYLQKKTLDFFDTSNITKINWQLANGKTINDEQKRAAISAASLPFCMITGGAGTGKTTTLTKALEMCLLNAPDCDIILATPTGKAAQRLNETILTQANSVNNSIKSLFIQLQAKTIHRILGIAKQSGRPLYNSKNPLPCDVFIIDEASMIGGNLFSLIYRAVLPKTRIILIGDANQLSAINDTAFFSDISRLPVGYSDNFCRTINPYLENSIKACQSPIPNAICHLSTSKRFAEESLINHVADAILTSKTNRLLDLLGDNFYCLSKLGDSFSKHLLDNYLDNKDWQQVTPKRIILCANRYGYFGSENINRYLDSVFRGNSESLWYAGRRIIIEQNDYQLDINNGDIGKCKLLDNSWYIIFDNNRKLPISALLGKKYSLAFAITIHKSQGSEYPYTDIVLDKFDKQNPNCLITRSLLYTAVTRAKEGLTLYGDSKLLDYVLKKQQKDLSPLTII